MGIIKANSDIIKSNEVSAIRKGSGVGRANSLRGPIIEDILNTQTSTIGTLHYSTTRQDLMENRQVRTLFTNSLGRNNSAPDFYPLNNIPTIADKVIRNELNNSWARINYNLGSASVFDRFTVTFEARSTFTLGNVVGGGFGFYWYAKGTYNPSFSQTYYACTKYWCESEICEQPVCYDWDECYDEGDGVCYDWNECYDEGCEGWVCDLPDYYNNNCGDPNDTRYPTVSTTMVSPVIKTSWDSFPVLGAINGTGPYLFGNRPDNDAYVVMINIIRNSSDVWWSSPSPLNQLNTNNLFGHSIARNQSILPITSTTPFQGISNGVRDTRWRKYKIQFARNASRNSSGAIVNSSGQNLIILWIDDRLAMVTVDPSASASQKNFTGTNFGLWIANTANTDTDIFGNPLSPASGNGQSEIKNFKFYNYIR